MSTVSKSWVTIIRPAQCLSFGEIKLSNAPTMESFFLDSIASQIYEVILFKIIEKVA